MKINLSKCDQEAPVAAVYYYDETTPLPSKKKKKKKRSPKSKDSTCQICLETKIKASTEEHDYNFDDKDILSSIKCVKCFQPICVPCFKRNLHPILCTAKGCKKCPSKVSFDTFGTGLMHTCPFCRFKTDLDPMTLCSLLLGNKSEVMDKFGNDDDAFVSWCRNLLQ